MPGFPPSSLGGHSLTPPDLCIGDGPLLPAPTSALHTSVSALLTLRPRLLFTPPLLCHLLTFQILSLTHHRLWVPTVFPSLVIARDVNGSSNTRVYRTITDYLNIKELHLHDTNFSLDAMPGTCPHLGSLYLCTGQSRLSCDVVTTLQISVAPNKIFLCPPQESHSSALCPSQLGSQAEGEAPFGGALSSGGGEERDPPQQSLNLCSEVACFISTHFSFTSLLPAKEEAQSPPRPGGQYDLPPSLSLIRTSFSQNILTYRFCSQSTPTTPFFPFL